ncbi:uncharacterized protein LOC121853349 [Homarus americanus]|nr:uncharacterized protein LOC121853349 [Homarus americanus]
MAFVLGGASAIIGGAALTAVAGAVGLALIGSARRNFGGRRSNRRRFGRRGRRAVDEEQSALNKMLELVKMEDTSSCGKKLMCELAAQPYDSLPQLGRDITTLVGSVKPGEGLLPPGGAGEYMGAKSYGALGWNCGELYNTCPYDSQQMMSILTYKLGY